MASSTITFVLGGTKNDRRRYVENLRKNQPDYAVTINQAFARTKKVGPFTVENKKSVLSIFLDDPVIKKLGQTYVVEQMKKLNADGEMYCRCKWLSPKELELFSLLFDVLKGKKHIMFHDVDMNPYGGYYFLLASWLSDSREFEQNNGSLVWVTELPEEEFIRRYAERLMTYESSHYIKCLYNFQFYKFQNGQLVAVERNEVVDKIVLQSAKAVQL